MPTGPKGEKRPATEKSGDEGLTTQSSQTGHMGQPAERPDHLKPLQAPLFYATGANISATGNDFTIILNRNVPVENADGSLNLGVAVAVPVAIVSVTPQTLKDISLIIPGILAAHEKEFGDIVTAFTKRLEADKAKKPE